MYACLGDLHLPADELAQLLDEHKDEIEKEVCHTSFSHIWSNVLVNYFFVKSVKVHNRVRCISPTPNGRLVEQLWLCLQCLTVESKTKKTFNQKGQKLLGCVLVQ